MSIDATRWAWQQEITDPMQKLILLSMADRADERHECWPSMTRLALDCCMCRRTVMRAIANLERTGLIKVDRTFGSNSHYFLIGVEDRHTKISGKNTKKLSTTSDSKSPVTESHQCTRVTAPVTVSHRTGDCESHRTYQEPTKNLSVKKTCRVAKKAAPKTTSARATRLPPDWELPDDWMEWTLTQLPLNDSAANVQFITRTAETFKDYWLAKAGPSAVKVDWFATWRNWVRRDQQQAGGNNESNRRILTSKRAAEWQRDVEMERWCNGES